MIELMIVVAIVGILAVLAAYGVRKYLANSKTAEARNSLGQIAKQAAGMYEKESMQSAMLVTGSSAALSRALCGSASVTVPASALSIKGRKYQAAASEWNADQAGNSGFACLRFEIDQPQYYMYNWKISGSGANPGDSFLASANGDLNGDGVLSTFSITGSINSTYILNVAPNLLEVNPDE